MVKKTDESPLGLLEGMMNTYSHERCDCFLSIEKPTPDDWHPTIDGIVHVTGYFYKKGPELWKFNVVGGDDTCMAMYTERREVKERTQTWLTNIAFLSMRDLLDWGFQYD